MTEALLVLEDGTSFRGSAFGAEGEAFGEAVFNTAMCGYQEVLTDPSYTGQIVTMTYPHQGNYGVNGDDPESDRVRVAAFVVREASRRTSSWRAERSLAEELAAAGVVGVEGIDTRRLTLRIRSAGAMRAGVSTVDLEERSLLERVHRQPGMEGADLAASAATAEPYEARAIVGPAQPVDGRVFRVAAYDFGIKRNILRLLAAGGCDATVFPARTSPGEVLAGRFDGVFVSNGPGDPAATTYGVEALRGLLGEIPVFGICLGNQLLGLALGGRTYKLKFGHRGVNQPVKDLETGRIEISSHNHGFAVDPQGWSRKAGGDPSAGQSPSPSPDPGADASAGQSPPNPRSGAGAPVVETEFGRVALTHWNLNDATLEGLRCLDVPAFSVQYHPEAAPGPHDSR
ncbi:MAG: glutamine-hydrolyzing carbamoyl-phosphate synthase small subunit, partial [Actinomycetota bacterium]